ncbi:AAA family ATPase [Pseudokineococcus marinus]|uniref:ATP-binding protein n=1 Tax=Pseudokineococcus marinus TaxID=351215 RepID=A0A849BLC8_9ACTN|nr:AAA family ATPase [Pseudokineococcus marinus]NNH22125.1 ATP-binding protein [Pseudokineococcus marinus]
MSFADPQVAPQFIRQQFQDRAGVEVLEISTRAYPDELNYIVFVAEADVAAGAVIGNELDDELARSGSRAFVIVRKAPESLVAEAAGKPVKLGVHDPRANDLLRLISARSRVSIAQPSLAYVKDAQANLSVVTAARHHLIFGRRGAGKTALLVEARRQAEEEGSLTCWSNIQSLRQETPHRVVLYVLEELLATLVSRQRHVRAESVVATDAAALFETVRNMLASRTTHPEDVTALVPRVQRALRRYLDTEGTRFYIYLDDFYYIARDLQPLVLDMLHGCVRDCDAWLKVASIRHLTRWFQSSPPLGLQTIHDAELIDLDVTLQEPKRAKQFLESVLLQYAKRVGVARLASIFSGEALDRLVLASGAVPRDYLVLASSAILKAQGRAKARLVGVQNVNQAAGDAAGAKLQELEDDMASNVDTAEKTLAALKIVREFCLDERAHTYFLVSYRDKENAPATYNLLTDLMDLRLIHLIDSGVSEAHAAGQRSEAFMLDLSQYSGARLKQRIHMLDFSGGRMISRLTHTSEPPRVGDTPRQVIAILRTAPRLELSRLDGVLTEA